MKVGWLPISILPIIVIVAGIPAQAQSLGDVAREQRAGRAGSTQPRVLTNDDIATVPAPAPAPAPTAKAKDEAPATTEATADNATPAEKDAQASEAKGDTANRTVMEAAAGDKDKGDKDAQVADEEKDSKSAKCKCPKDGAVQSKDADIPGESEADRRTREINQGYIEQIGKIREQIAKTEEDIGRLQRDQLESTAQFRRSVGGSPSNLEYEAQQRTFNEQIEAKRGKIDSLRGQLEAAQEAARHAGVAHSSDY